MGEAALRWLEFATVAAVIGLAGTRLSRYGDAIAAKTSMSGSWIGLVLVATVTSLPELVTGASAAAVARLPDIAVGNVLGACVLNLTMLVVLDFLHRGESLYSRASQGHILSAGFVIVMLGFTGLNLLVADDTAALALGHVGLASPVLVALYALAIRTLWSYERTQLKEAIPELAERYADLTLRQVLARYAIAAAFVVTAALWLPFAAARLAAAMRWGETFVGTLFVAMATTLPELAVTIAAARIGALDLAIGNLLGSSLFNLTILAFDDVLFVEGPILAAASPIHAVSAVSALIMAGIVVVGLLYRPRGRVLRTVGWASIGLATVYVLNALVQYVNSG
jgi:cation:H+ antiporter